MSLGDLIKKKTPRYQPMPAFLAHILHTLVPFSDSESLSIE